MFEGRSDVLDAFCVQEEDAAILVDIKMEQVLALLNGPVSIIAVEEPLAIVGMGKTSNESDAIWQRRRGIWSYGV
jgi:hypothetical protein